MLPLHEAVRRALSDLEIWLRLHPSDDDSDLDAWRALVTLRDATSALVQELDD